MADTFALSWAPTDGQAATRGAVQGTNTTTAAELLNQPNQVTSGGVYPRYISHALTGARRGVELAIWNDADSGKILDIARIDMTWARADNAAATPYEANMALRVTTCSSVSGGTGLTPVCLDDIGTALPGGITVRRDATCTIGSVLRSIFPSCLSRLQTSNMTIMPTWNLSPAQHRSSPGVVFFVGVGDAQGLVVRAGEAMQFSWDLNPSYYLSELEYELTLTNGTHTWVVRLNSVPYGAAVLCLDNPVGSGETITVVGARMGEGQPVVLGNSAPVHPGIWFLRGIERAYLNNGKDLAPVALSGGTWPAGVHAVAGAAVDHFIDAEPVEPVRTRDFLRPIAVLTNVGLGYAKASAAGVAFSGPTPTLSRSFTAPIRLRPGEGVALDNDALTFNAGNYSGVTSTPARIDFMVTVEDAPVVPSGGGESAYAFVG